MKSIGWRVAELWPFEVFHTLVGERTTDTGCDFIFCPMLLCSALDRQLLECRLGLLISQSMIIATSKLVEVTRPEMRYWRCALGLPAAPVIPVADGLLWTSALIVVNVVIIIITQWFFVILEYSYSLQSRSHNFELSHIHHNRNFIDRMLFHPYHIV